MEKLPHLAGVGANERNLFHGTPDEATVRCICSQNFDPRMHGRHGTVYGKGVYFSATAKYSHQYTQPCPKSSGRRFMFFARTLVGKSTLGKPELQRPPPVDPSRPHGALFDSCVNNTSNPTIFVFFDNDQCYPEFLIEYEFYEQEETSRVFATMPPSSAAAAATSSSSHSLSSTRRPSPTASTRRAYTTRPISTEFNSLASTLRSLSSTSRPGSTRSPSVTTAQTYTSRPVPTYTSRPVPASTQARPTSQSTASTTGIHTNSHGTPINTAHSAQAQPPVSSDSVTKAPAQKGCVMM